MEKLNSETFYTKMIEIEKVSLSKVDEESFGFDWENQKLEIIDDKYYDAGLVNISKLIDVLINLKENGANYVVCDWHCDHRELDVYGVKYRPATEEEIEQLKEKQNAKKETDRQAEINRLEQKLKRLKDGI
jgi:hypothetical protein